MTFFDDDRYNWRETYFVYFESSHRPKLPEVRRALQTYAPFLSVLHSKADRNDNLAEMTIASYEDHAALEILFREGKAIQSEAQHFARTLKKDGSQEERAKLQKIEQCNMRLDIHHFEQLAGTSVFNITKLPELKFSKQSAYPINGDGIFSKALKPGGTDKGKFYFDPDSFDQCRSENAGEESDVSDEYNMDSGEFERINPEMLVTVLEILRRTSHGIALDPSSGIILE